MEWAYKLVNELTALVELCGDSLTGSEKEEVLHFVKYDEYRLALQTCADIFYEEKKPMPEAVRIEMIRIAENLSIDPDELFEGTNQNL